MDDKQQALSRFETPPDVADLLLGFCLRRPSDRLLDPSCGTGAFLQRAALWRDWLADSPADLTADGLWGVALDSETAVSAQTALPQAHILQQNFFTLTPDNPFDAIISNPPYAPAEQIGRLHRESGEQMSFEGIGDWGSATKPQETTRLIPRHLWQKLSHRSGLHAYFLLHSVHFLREGGRLGFIVPNGWLDVAYSAKLKQFLLNHFRIVALIESNAERWFPKAPVDACLIVLEKCSGSNRRAANLTRLIRLKRPLTSLIPQSPNSPRRMMTVERLVPRLLPSDNRRTPDFDVRVLPQWKLDAKSKWGLTLRAPAVYRQQQNRANLSPLKSWAAVQRGFTTGANKFFYLDAAAIDEWKIEPAFRRPLLKTLRGLDKLKLAESDCQTELLWLPPGTHWQETAVARYIDWGEAQGFQRRSTCASRHPWISLPELPPAQIVLPASMLRRQFAPLLTQNLATDQQLYRLSLAAGIAPLAAAALFNSAWFALQCELQGRVSFGKGLLRLAAYELENILLPDPRQLTTAQTAELERCFEQLAQRPIGDIQDELTQPDRQALDTAVFDILTFTAAERTAVRKALLDHITIRQQHTIVT